MNVARRLALGRLVSLSGGSAAYIGLVAAIYGETGSALWVSAAIFSSVVASVASAPGAGWIGDRFDRRRVLIGSDVAAAVVSLAMAATANDAATPRQRRMSQVALGRYSGEQPCVMLSTTAVIATTSTGFCPGSTLNAVGIRNAEPSDCCGALACVSGGVADRSGHGSEPNPVRC